MTEIINLTPHVINLVNVYGETQEIPPDGRVPRVAMTRTVVDQIAGVPVVEVTTGAVENLPDPAPGSVYIVSRAVAEALPRRRDLLAPDELVRDDAGRVVGCRQLGRVPEPAPAADKVPGLDEAADAAGAAAAEAAAAAGGSPEEIRAAAETARNERYLEWATLGA